MLSFNLLRHSRVLINSATSINSDQISQHTPPTNILKIRVNPALTRAVFYSFSSTPIDAQEKMGDHFESTTSPNLSDRISDTQNSRSSSGFWGVIGTFLTAAYLLKKYRDSPTSAHCDEERTILSNEPLDSESIPSSTEIEQKTPPQKSEGWWNWFWGRPTTNSVKDTKPKYTHMHAKDLNERFPNTPLISIPSSWTLVRDGDFQAVPCYKINDKNGFRVMISEHGQLIWRSADKVEDKDLREIAELYETLLPPRSILINTGVHGDRQGNLFVQKDCGNFVMSDINTFDNLRRTLDDETYVPIASHTVSHGAPPKKPHEYPKLDFIDAWCWSVEPPNLSYLSTGEIAPAESQTLTTINVINSFRVLGWTNPISPTNSYSEPNGLFSDIQTKIEKHGVCYVHGIAGMGKTRSALEIQNTVINNIRDPNNPYFDVVFISLTDKEPFIKHVKSIIPFEEKDQEIDLLQKYFDLIEKFSHQKNKRVLVIADNIDSDKQLQWFRDNILDVLKEHQQDEHLFGPFDLVITGQRNPIKDQKLPPEMKRQEYLVTMGDYYHDDETIWGLFKNNVLEKAKPHDSRAKDVLSKHKTSLLELINKIGNHPALTVYFGIYLGQAIRNQTIDREWLRIQDLVKILDKASMSCGPGDYKILSETIQWFLSTDSGRYPENARKFLFDIICLLSKNTINIGFLSSLLDEFDEGQEHSKRICPHLYHIIHEFEELGVLQRFDDGGEMALPEFYHYIGRYNLLGLPKPLPEQKIDQLVEMIFNLLEKDHFFINKMTQSLSLIYLINLLEIMRFENERYSVLLEKTEHRLTNCASKIWKEMPISVQNIKSNEEFSNIITFFYKISRMSDYSIDKTIIKFLYYLAFDLAYNLSYNKLFKNTIHEINIIQATLLLNPKRTIIKVQRLNNIFVLLTINHLLFNYKINNETKSFKSINEEEIHDFITEIYYILEKSIHSLKENSFYDTHTNYADYFNIIKCIENNLNYVKKNKINEMIIFPRIEHIDVNKEEKRNVKKWISNNSDKEKINLINTCLGKGFAMLKGQLPFYVEVINLSNNRLGYDERSAEGVMHLLEQHPFMGNDLILSSNSLGKGKNQFVMILDGISSIYSFNKLDLSSNDLQDEDIENLCHILKNKRFQQIDLTNNNFSQIGLSYLLKLMENNLKITSIITAQYFLGRSVGVRELTRDKDGKIIEHRGELQIRDLVDLSFHP